ncbi:MAG: hypothetical protein H6645_05430 [Caldilineaceae bacterium]|nr:hypothetical protein [Caldilineaceae bacterium]
MKPARLKAPEPSLSTNGMAAKAAPPANASLVEAIHNNDCAQPLNVARQNTSSYLAQGEKRSRQHFSYIDDPRRFVSPEFVNSAAQSAIARFFTRLQHRRCSRNAYRLHSDGPLSGFVQKVIGVGRWADAFERNGGKVPALVDQVRARRATLVANSNSVGRVPSCSPAHSAQHLIKAAGLDNRDSSPATVKMKVRQAQPLAKICSTLTGHFTGRAFAASDHAPHLQ